MRFDPDHLAALATILRRGSFEAAAAELSVTPSAISQRIKALEDRIGASLINRGSPCTATATGARLAKHAEDVGLLEAQLGRDLTLEADGAAALVRIAVNADSLATWFVSALSSVPGLAWDGMDGGCVRSHSLRRRQRQGQAKASFAWSRIVSESPQMGHTRGHTGLHGVYRYTPCNPV